MPALAPPKPFRGPQLFRQSVARALKRPAEHTASLNCEFIRGNMATTKVATAPMKAAQISKPGADFQIVDREIPKPAAGQVCIKVQACRVCHSDVLTKEGQWPGIQHPRVPGHEVAAVIYEIGTGVSCWAAGTAAEDTLRFAELTGVRPMIETYPLEKAGEAYARMMSGKAQFRVVLTM